MITKTVCESCGDKFEKDHRCKQVSQIGTGQVWDIMQPIGIPLYEPDIFIVNDCLSADATDTSCGGDF